MKLITLFIVFAGLVFFLCTKKAEEKNPFLEEYTAPFNAPPFDKIEKKHYLPALNEGIKQQQKEIDDIAKNPEPPTFKNTVEAMDKCGDLLRRVNRVLENMNGAMTDDSLQKIAKEAAPLLCAGIIGYRALRRSQVQPGQRLGLYGFGGSAHITIQIFNCYYRVSTQHELNP